MKRWACLASEALLLCVLCCSEAGAGTLDIRPDEFRPVTSGSDYLLHPQYAVGDAAFLTTVIKLPVKKTVKKLTLYYNNGYQSAVAAALFRVKMGSPGQQMVLVVADTQSPDAQIQKITSADIDFPTVASGYTYYLLVHLANNNTLLYGVQVTYQ